MTAFSVLAQTAPATSVTTPSIEWYALLPVIILAVGAVLLLTIASLARGHLFRGFYALYTVAVATAAIIASLPVWARVQGWSEIWGIGLTHPNGVGPFSTVAGAVGIDGFSIFVTVVICGAVIIGALVADGYLRRERLEGPEFYVLMLLSATGGLIMAMANDLIVMFLGLETLSIAAYILTAMHLRRAQSQEGGLKYFILGAFSSAFFLYGVALIYGATGSTSLITIKSFMAGNIPIDNGLLLLGLALMLVGFGFKFAAMPFHAWSPDAYDGAPTPAVVYMAAGVKAAAFAGLVRVFMLTFSNYASDWQPIVYALAVVSMVGGALLAIVQTNVKRMMAYSSISHAGFILVAVEAASDRGVQAVLFYLAAYTFMIAGTFAVISVVGRTGDGRHELSDYRGLSHAHPALSLVFTVFLLAQAGVPFTSGFFAKFYVIIASVDVGSWPLALVAMVSAVIAAFLYLRLVVSMYMSPPEGEEVRVATRFEGGPVRVGVGAWVGIAACLLITLAVGIVPDTVLDPAQKATPALVQVADATPAAANTGGIGAGSAGTTPGPGG